MKELEGSEVLTRSREQLYCSFEEDSSMGLGMLNPTFLIKDKTVSAGKNFIDETKSYQNKEWSDEKK
mgnify:CR=1 FL=1